MNRPIRSLPFVLALVLALVPAAAAQGYLVAELTLSSARFDVGEEIPVHVLLRNAGPGEAEATGALYSLMTRAVRVTLFDRATGDEVHELLHWCGPGQLGRPVTLAAGQWLQNRFDLQEIHPLLPAGAYRLDVECRSGDGWVKAWPVDFAVNEPGRVEADRVGAYDAVLKLDEGPERALALERFLDRHAATPLRFAAARELAFSYYHAGDPDRALQVLSGLLGSGLSEPRASMIRWTYGRVLAERGFRAEAIRHFAFLGDLDSENVLATL